MGLLRVLRVPVGWKDLLIKTGREMIADNCLGLAALSYYFVLALFPALLFLVAVISFIPVSGLLDTITGTLARVAPSEVITIIQDQVLKVAHDKNGGLLTLGMLGTIWSTSSGVDAIIDTLNQAYDINESRPWWKVKATALALTVGLALFIVVAFGLVVAGPQLAEKVANWFHLGPAFEWSWKILQWPVVFARQHGHRDGLLLCARRTAGVDLDYSRFDSRDSAMAAGFARLPLLRHPFRVLQRHLRRDRRRHHPDVVVLCVRSRRSGRCRTECRN
jgi:hypothetical protein